MENKIDYVINKIQQMQETEIQDESGRIFTVGEVAKSRFTELKQQPFLWVNNHVEALINTALNIRQKTETVKKRMKVYRKNYSHIKNLYDLKKLINSMSEKECLYKVLGFNKVKKLNNPRYNVLKAMIEAFISYQKRKGFSSDYEAMKDWAHNFDLSNLNNDALAEIHGVGLARVQNLRMCLGVDTVKPDVHIENALKELGYENCSKRNVVEICEWISELTGYSCLELDQIFWHYGKKGKANEKTKV